MNDIIHRNIVRYIGRLALPGQQPRDRVHARTADPLQLSRLCAKACGTARYSEGLSTASPPDRDAETWNGKFSTPSPPLSPRIPFFRCPGFRDIADEPIGTRTTMSGIYGQRWDFSRKKSIYIHINLLINKKHIRFQDKGFQSFFQIKGYHRALGFFQWSGNSKK